MYKTIITKNGTDEKYINDICETIEDANKWVSDISNHLTKLGVSFNIEGPIDLKQDAAWVEKDIQKKRKSEYPQELEILEALLEEIEGRPEKLTEILMKRNDVKLKYPKPVKQGK